MTLPLEIREAIWKEVLGGRLIHICNPSAWKITHVVCRAPISNTQAQLLYPFPRPDEDDLWWRHEQESASPPHLPTWDWYSHKLSAAAAANDDEDEGANDDIGNDNNRDPKLRSHNYRHALCFSDSWILARTALISPSEEPDTLLQEKVAEVQLSLTVLRTSRAVHAEASRALWSGNDFSFGKSTTFHNFVLARSPVQLEMLRHLSLRTERPLPVLAPDELANTTYTAVQGSFWSKALALLPNLNTLFLAARYELTWQVARAVWCEGRLVTPDVNPAVKEARAIELVDDLPYRPRLRSVCLHVEAIEVGDLYYAHSLRKYRCDQLRDSLQELLRRRIERRRRIISRSAGGQGEEPPYPPLYNDDSGEGNSPSKRREQAWEAYVEGLRQT